MSRSCDQILLDDLEKAREKLIDQYCKTIEMIELLQIKIDIEEKKMQEEEFRAKYSPQKLQELKEKLELFKVKDGMD